MHDSIANQLLSFSIIQHGQPNKPKTNSLTCKPTQTELENSHTITLKQSNQDPIHTKKYPKTEHFCGSRHHHLNIVRKKREREIWVTVQTQI